MLNRDIYLVGVEKLKFKIWELQLYQELRYKSNPHSINGYLPDGLVLILISNISIVGLDELKFKI